MGESFGRLARNIVSASHDTIDHVNAFDEDITMDGSLGNKRGLEYEH